MGQVIVPKLNIIKGPLGCKAWTVKTRFLKVVSGVLGQKSGVLGQGLDGAWLGDVVMQRICAHKKKFTLADGAMPRLPELFPRLIQPEE